MKIKKLLAVGAIASVLVSSLSVGALAAERPTNDQIKKDMIKLFLSGNNPLNYDLNSQTTVSSVIDTDSVETYATKYSYTYLYAALGDIDPSKTVMDNVKVIFTNYKGDDLKKLLVDVKNVAYDLKKMENYDETEKIKKENDLINLFKSKDSNIDVKFGRNIDGNITMSITKAGKVILQLTSQNAYTINNALGNNSDKLIQYAALLEIL